MQIILTLGIAGIRAGSRRLNLYGGTCPFASLPRCWRLTFILHRLQRTNGGQPLHEPAHGRLRRHPGDVSTLVSLSVHRLTGNVDRPYDNSYAIKQIEEGHKAILKREAYSPLGNDSVTGMALEPLSRDGKSHPRVITVRKLVVPYP